jgi:hypothetical protein
MSPGHFLIGHLGSDLTSPQNIPPGEGRAIALFLTYKSAAISEGCDKPMQSACKHWHALNSCELLADGIARVNFAAGIKEAAA